MLNILLEKVGNIHEHTENFSREKKNESNKMLGATTTMKKTRQQKWLPSMCSLLDIGSNQ